MSLGREENKKKGSVRAYGKTGRGEEDIRRAGGLTSPEQNKGRTNKRVLFRETG